MQNHVICKKKANLKTKGYRGVFVEVLKSIRRENGRKTLGQGKTFFRLSSSLILNCSCHSVGLPSLLKMAACCSRFVPGTKCCCVMHQSIPAAPQPPPGYCGAFTRLVSPGGGAFANFVLPGGRAFANPRAILELLT